MLLILSITLIAAFAALNRIRGGGLGAHLLPGHPRFWVTPVIFYLAWRHLGDWQSAAWFAGVFLAWSLQPWGDIYMLGRPRPDGKEVPDFGTCCLGLWTLGMLAGICLFPVASGMLGRDAAFGLAPIMPLAYWLGWKAFDRWPSLKAQTTIAEPLIGAWWGVILVFL